MDVYTQPNILMIVVDQWRGDCLSSLGHPAVETPFLDDLSLDGIVYKHAYAQAPSCIPARACLATGQSPYTCGRIGYSDSNPWEFKDTLMHGLRDGGYQTINVGKTHFYPQRNHLGFEINELYDPQSLDKGFTSDYHYWLNQVSNGLVKDPAIEWDNNSWVCIPWQGPDEYHPSQWTVNRAKQLLGRRDPTRPFFMQLSFHRPHPPYDAPQYFLDMYKDKELHDLPSGEWSQEYAKTTYKINASQGVLTKEQTKRMRRGYYASITHVDYMIGRMIQWLKNQQMYEDTYIIFISDHGELLGDHFMYRKINPFEGSAKIPLIIKPCKKANTLVNAVSDIPCSHLDILPTIYNIAGIQVPEKVEGICLQSNERRPYIHGEHTGYGNEGWQYITNGKWKYIWETYSGREYFFDLINDPNEKMNCIKINKYKDQVEYCRNELIRILISRPEYDLTECNKLKPGTRLPDYIERRNSGIV